MLAELVAALCLIWYIAVICVSALGYTQIYRYYRNKPHKSRSATLPHEQIPHVTIIRPVKGLEPYLYECLAATFQQAYPFSKLTISFCVSDRNDPSLPVLRKLVGDYPKFDSRILIEDEDASLQGEDQTLGPNPKIRNMSQAYREAKGDIIWIIDCNVWIGAGVCGRLVDLLCGLCNDGPRKRFKFVHQLPVVVDVTTDFSPGSSGPLLSSSGFGENEVASTSTAAYETGLSSEDKSATVWQQVTGIGGGRLEELFMSSSHAKFYTAINTVLLAPCIVGKSNMFRKSHLDAVTSSASGNEAVGIDHFSYNICEDHLIGDLLWKSQVPEEQSGEKFGKHCMLFGDPAIQPMARMRISEYVARRVRWLRVRKYTVLLATLIEPGTESFLCSLYGAYALMAFGFISPTVGAFVGYWLLSITIWAVVDWTLFLLLHAVQSIENDEETPAFARSHRRPFGEWLLAWLGREALALPVWSWAVLGGGEVVWRGRRFYVGTDMLVRSLDEPHATDVRSVRQDGIQNGGSKARRE